MTICSQSRLSDDNLSCKFDPASASKHVVSCLPLQLLRKKFYPTNLFFLVKTIVTHVTVLTVMASMSEGAGAKSQGGLR